MEKLKIRVQCPSIKSNTVGTFLSGCITGKQYTKTYNNCVELFNSTEYKKLKKHIN